MTAGFLGSAPLAEPRVAACAIVNPSELVSPTHGAPLLALPIPRRARDRWEN